MSIISWHWHRPFCAVFISRGKKDGELYHTKSAHRSGFMSTVRSWAPAVLIGEMERLCSTQEKVSGITQLLWKWSVLHSENGFLKVGTCEHSHWSSQVVTCFTYRLPKWNFDSSYWRTSFSSSPFSLPWRFSQPGITWPVSHNLPLTPLGIVCLKRESLSPNRSLMRHINRQQRILLFVCF